VVGVARTDLSSRSPTRHDAEAALAATFGAYHARIYTYLRMLVCDASLAEDLLRDTFVEASAFPRPDEQHHLKVSLYRIATDAARSALLRRRVFSWMRLRPSPSPSQGTRNDDFPTLARERALVVRALSCLTLSQTACLLLRFQHGLSYTELAEIFGVSAPAARMQVCRAQATLRETYLRIRTEEIG
jgi:RNA polymerase sigma factor (sigma-70 family)